MIASIGASIGLFGMGAVSDSAVAAAATVCGSRQPFQVHYTITAAPGSAKAPHLTVASSVAISGLAAGCDGQTAKLLLSGNSAGDPSTPASLLSTAFSKVDPCTGTTVSRPPTVAGGAITFPLCPTTTTPTKGAAVSVHDLTRLTLTVGGKVVVETTTASSSSSSSGTTSASNNANSGSGSGSGSGSHNVPVATVTSSTSSLAFTGAEIAAMVAAGLLLVLAGLLFLLMSRRRRSRASDGSAES